MTTWDPDGFVFTSESVTGGHPDKMADQISDTILDAALGQDPDSRVAVETLLTTGLIVIAGELTTKAVLDYASLARDCVRDIGYVGGEIGFDADAVGVLVALDKQSPDIAQGVTPRGRCGPACMSTPTTRRAPVTRG